MKYFNTKSKAMYHSRRVSVRPGVYEIEPGKYLAWGARYSDKQTGKMIGDLWDAAAKVYKSTEIGK